MHFAKQHFDTIEATRREKMGSKKLLKERRAKHLLKERANMSFMNEADFRASLFGSAVTLLHFKQNSYTG